MWGDLQWHDVHAKFNEKFSIGTNFMMGTDTRT
jgi:hypothetical protein